ncbi:MAG: helix-turn-helix domain-containing protein [Erysipelotrichaceae bacterium]|nr:helix-turn-helix domain-containing protein [Erysipelotrichaceae bacterium]
MRFDCEGIYVHNVILQLKDISLSSRIVLSQIVYSYKDDSQPCYASYDNLSQRTGISRGSVMNAVKKLEAAGYVTKKHRFKESKAQTSNYFYVTEKTKSLFLPENICNNDGDKITNKLSANHLVSQSSNQQKNSKKKKTTIYIERRLSMNYENNEVNQINDDIIENDHPTKEEFLDAITNHNRIVPLGRFIDLQNLLKLQSNDLVTIAAPTNFGKTPFLMNVFIECLKDKNNYCQYYSMEGNLYQSKRNLVAITSQLTVEDVCNYTSLKKKNDPKSQIIDKGLDFLGSSAYYYDVEPKNIEQLKKDIKNHIKRDKQNIVIIDYLGLISIKDTTYNKSEYDRISYIIRELRSICLRYNVLIFIGSQFARDPLKKDDLNMFSLKGSGEVENSSTHVILLYEDTEEPLKGKDIVNVKVDVVKNRNYYAFDLSMTFDKSRQFFDEVSL